MTDYRQYEVWKAAHALVTDVYDVISRFPSAERYALSEQLRRSVTSIPCNIAEALGRSRDRERAHLINVSRGSAAECDYQLLLARDLGYLSHQTHANLKQRLDGIRRMLAVLHRRMVNGTARRSATRQRHR